MRRLYVVGEGSTEVAFATQLLKPHLENLSSGEVVVVAPNLRGHRTYAKTRKLIMNLLSGGDPDVRVTTMVDVFKLPADFPGRDVQTEDPLKRAKEMEALWGKDIDDDRFMPNLQVHEYEALVLADLTVLSEEYPSRRREIEELTTRIAKFPTPEHVNRQRPPSYWILEAVPEYNRRLDGIVTASKIGLFVLRAKCKHLGGWLDLLETMVVSEQ